MYLGLVALVLLTLVFFGLKKRWEDDSLKFDDEYQNVLRFKNDRAD